MAVIVIYLFMIGKAAYIAVSEKKGGHIKIDESNLKDFVGKPVYAKDKMYEKTPPGKKGHSRPSELSKHCIKK